MLCYKPEILYAVNILIYWIWFWIDYKYRQVPYNLWFAKIIKWKLLLLQVFQRIPEKKNHNDETILSLLMKHSRTYVYTTYIYTCNWTISCWRNISTNDHHQRRVSFMVHIFVWLPFIPEIIMILPSCFWSFIQVNVQ